MSAMGSGFAAYEMVVDTRTREGLAPRRRKPLAGPYGWAQGLLVAAGWSVFLWAWVSVVRHTAPSTMLWTLGLLAACGLANEAITLGWIHHNLRIFARKGQRKAVFVPEHEFVDDFLNREIVADWKTLRDAGTILVGFDDVRKTYVPYRGDPTAENLFGRAGLEAPDEDRTV